MGSCGFASVKAWSYNANLAFSIGCRNVVFCSPAQAAGSASGWNEAASKKEIRGGNSERGEMMCMCLLERDCGRNRSVTVKGDTCLGG